MKAVIEYNYPEDEEKLRYALCGETAVKAILSIREVLDVSKSTKADTISRIDQIVASAMLEFKRV
jgi:hypothetical protein